MRRLASLLLAAAGGIGGTACSEQGSDDSADAQELIVLVSVDTLRADRLGAYGSQRGLTPAIDALAEESHVFVRAYAPTSFTMPSVSAILTGLNPEQIGILTNEYVLDPEVPTLAELLAERGFSTGAVVANFVLRRASGLDRGFDAYDDRFTAIETARGVPEQTAATTADDALAMLDLLGESSDRRFLWAHFQDPHGPYTPPAELLEPLLDAELARPDGRRELPAGGNHSGLGAIPAYQLLGDERRAGFYRAAYDAEVRYLDREVGRLLAGLRERGLYERATIVFCADHGEGLGEQDYWFAHGEYLSDPLVRVPLLIKLGRSSNASQATAVEHAELAGLVDVFPTLAALVGAALPNGLAGRDLLATGARPPRALVLAALGASTRPRFGFLFEDRKLLVTLDPMGRLKQAQVFEAPDESVDLAASEPELADELIGAMTGARRTLAAPRYQARELEPTEADIESLRRLGYVE